MRTCAGIGCDVDLTGSYFNRKFCSDRCRRSQYCGRCKACGGLTDGSQGWDAPEHCHHCAPAAYAKWSRELIVEKVREWADLYGQPPTAADWNPAMYEARNRARAPEIRARFESGDWPDTATVQSWWGRWNAAIEAAGFEALAPMSGRRG